MKIFAHLVVFFVLARGISQATPDLDALEERVRTALSGPEWQIVKDLQSITLMRTNVQFLNPISLPVGRSEEERWRRFSFRSDYRITIRLGTKMTQAEYDDLSAVQRELTIRRTAGFPTNSKDFATRRGQAQALVRLPSYYYSDRFSVYLYTTDFGFLLMQPDSVTITRDKVVAILEELYRKYTTVTDLPKRVGTSPFELALYDSQGLRGGQELFILTNGVAYARIERLPKKGEIGLQERRFKVQLTSNEVQALRTLLDQQQFLTLSVTNSTGVPDEAGSTISLRLADGQRREVFQWKKSEQVGFKAIHQHLLAIIRRAEKTKPVFEGQSLYKWTPEGFDR
jgi:hypothetical protein